MNGREFLAVARTLARGPTEGEWRSAVSRAYYAAFHAARDLLTVFGFRAPRADRAHEYLYRRLNNCGLPAARAAAGDLHDLRRLRNEADYDVGVPYAVGIATKAVAAATRIVQTLDALTPAERTQITDAMKVYEQGIGDVTWTP
jgi:uncharacterized protein (UPF0332 family)